MASITKNQIQDSVRKILKGADLSSLSSKKVRRMLEEEYDADFADRKQEIDDILMSCMSEEEDSQNSQQTSNGKDSPAQLSHNSDLSDKDDLEIEEPPKKKAKPSPKAKAKKSPKAVPRPSIPADSSDDQVDDEEFAKQLQEEEEEETGRRRSRHRSVKKSPVRRKKKPTSEKKERKGTSTYSLPCALSPELAAIMGTDRMPRNLIVKKMWEIVRERKLEDPKNRQFMLCDEELLKVFGKKRVRTFGMMKFLKSHIKDVKDIVE